MSEYAEYSDIPEQKEEGSTEDKVTESTEAKVEETTSSEEEVQLSPEQEKALTSGWTSQEDWEAAGKDPEDWVDYKEFNRRGELMDRIKSESKQRKTLEKRLESAEKMIRNMGEYTKKISQREFDRAYNALKQEKADALAEERHEDVVDLDEKMGELKEAHAAAEKESASEEEFNTASQEAGTPPEVEEWLDKSTNSWYAEDVAMRGAADAYVVEYMKANGETPQTTDWSKALSHVDKEIRKAFPHKFSNTRRPTGTTVTEDTGTRVPTKGKKKSLKDVDNDNDRQILQTWVDQGVMTLDDALDQYFN